ncbi:wings apart-like protein 1 [Podospora fimiseda]|uniref:Wings apart-like protein 1 n=1 Tax=Podospora fimiseda TaxID=252190 RepID=A0AAN7BV03_9PEZI|nr:wings apart-like protein 1 [Podospora fimiseda]
MASTSEYDFGFAPKKKTVTTYGRAARRRVQSTTTTSSSTTSTLRHAESAPPIITDDKSSSSSPEPVPRLRTLSSSKSKDNPRRTGQGSTFKRSDEALSQPIPDPYDIYAIEDDDETEVRPRKRTHVRGYSEKITKSTAAYSTPDASPSGARSPDRPAIPRSIPSEDTRAAAKRHGTPEKDVEMDDIPPPSSMPFSVKSSKIFKDLSVSAKPLNNNYKISKPAKTQMPIRLSGSRPSLPKPTTAKEPPSLSRAATDPVILSRTLDTKTPKKRRLIDTLVEQADEESNSEEELPSSQDSQIFRIRRSPALGSPSPQPTMDLDTPKPTAPPVLPSKKSGGPKFTYSQQRSMLADEDDFGGGGLGGRLGLELDSLDDEPKGALFNFGRLTKSAALKHSYLDEDDETANSGAVRSIHELRQAGANSRFADEMDDILDRIGLPSQKPSSLRRGALLELAQKMKSKEFRRQFRDHGGDGTLFKSLGEETDLVCGFSLLAIITTLLAASTSARLIPQLRSQGLGTLVHRLLEQPSDVSQLSKDRKQNMSRNSQTTMSVIKSSLLELPIWKPFSPTHLSPRTLALKCLDLLVRESNHGSDDEMSSKPVSDQVFTNIREGASNPACWDFPNSAESCDFYLSMLVAEGHSLYAMQTDLHGRWTERYSKIVAQVLETALARPVDKFDELESLTLKIAINVTNHNRDACRLFVGKQLLGRLAESAWGVFNRVMHSMKVDAFLSQGLDALIVMLGVMINFCVYYPPASHTLEESGDGAASPLNQLVRVFADNHLKTADADSMEKTQLNVALGYLAVLLGYLCLNDSIRDRFIAVHPKKSLRPLLDSINEFIILHHKAAEAQGEDGSKGESAAVARLESLANQLEAQCW